MTEKETLETQVENLGVELAEEMGIPTWALVAILIGKSKQSRVNYSYYFIRQKIDHHVK